MKRKTPQTPDTSHTMTNQNLNHNPRSNDQGESTNTNEPFLDEAQEAVIEEATSDSLFELAIKPLLSKKDTRDLIQRMPLMLSVKELAEAILYEFEADAIALTPGECAWLYWAVLQCPDLARDAAEYFQANGVPVSNKRTKRRLKRLAGTLAPMIQGRFASRDKSKDNGPLSSDWTEEKEQNLNHTERLIRFRGNAFTAVEWALRSAVEIRRSAGDHGAFERYAQWLSENKWKGPYLKFDDLNRGDLKDPAKEEMVRIYEGIIERGKEGYSLVLGAFAHIEKRRLYKHRYGTFDEYQTWMLAEISPLKRP